VSYKLASSISLLFFFGVGLAFFLSARQMPTGFGHDVGPGFLPTALSLIMMSASVVGLISTLRKPDDRRLEFPAPGMLAFTAGLAVVFVAAWYVTEHFYPVTFLTLAALLYVLNPQSATWRKLASTLIVAGALVGIIYVLFGRVLGIRF